jgi:hypothetical protein
MFEFIFQIILLSNACSYSKVWTSLQGHSLIRIILSRTWL